MDETVTQAELIDLCARLKVLKEEEHASNDLNNVGPVLSVTLALDQLIGWRAVREFDAAAADAIDAKATDAAKAYKAYVGVANE